MNDGHSGAMAWLSGGGAMGVAVREKDWSSTPLGPTERWSESIRAVVGLCIHSPLPILLTLGPDLTIVYNDAFIPFLGSDEPRLIVGSSGRKSRSALWQVVGPLHEEVASGRAGSATASHVLTDARFPGGALHATFACSPVLSADGNIEGVFCPGVTGPAPARRRDLDERLRESEERLRAAVDLVGMGIYGADRTNQNIEWNARLKTIWGLAPDAAVDVGVFIRGIHPDDRERVQASLGQSLDPAGDGICDIEYRVVGVHGGAERWVATRGKTLFENGQPAGFHGTVLDISDRKRVEQANGVLIGELEHRTRNLLSVVSALAEQTIASCDSLGDFAAPFRKRLGTLSRAQGLLSRGDARPVMLRELLEPELQAIGAEPDGRRVVVSGRDVALPSRAVQILALGLHELAVNAHQHGALGVPGGQLFVSWQVTTTAAKPRLTLEWRESGIAARRAPIDSDRVGVGRTLIEQSLPFQLDAQTRLEIGRDIVRCVLSLPLEETVSPR